VVSVHLFVGVGPSQSVQLVRSRRVVSCSAVSAVSTAESAAAVGADRRVSERERQQGVDVEQRTV